MVAVLADRHHPDLLGWQRPRDEIEQLAIDLLLGGEAIQGGADLEQRAQLVRLSARRRRRLGPGPKKNGIVHPQACDRLQRLLEQRGKRRGIGVEHEHENRLPELDVIAIGQQMVGDLRAVDEGAVRALRITDAPGAVGGVD